MVDSAIVASGPYPKGASQAHGLGAAAKEIAFIDPAVSDVHGRLGPDLDPTPLNRAEPAPRQMANALAGRQGLNAIHIIAHGAWRFAVRRDACADDDRCGVRRSGMSEGAGQ